LWEVKEENDVVRLKLSKNRVGKSSFKDEHF